MKIRRRNLQTKVINFELLREHCHSTDAPPDRRHEWERLCGTCGAYSAARKSPRAAYIQEPSQARDSHGGVINPGPALYARAQPCVHGVWAITRVNAA